MTVSAVADAALSDGREHLYRMTQPPAALLDQSFGNSGSAWTSYLRHDSGHHHSKEITSSAAIIPTAIVKPKYQKILHDDRQLLTNAGGYVDYNSKGGRNNYATSYNNSNAGNLCANKRVHNNKLQAAFEEATRKKKSLGVVHRIQSPSSSCSASTSSGNALVGVVTPRKKNYNEIGSAPGNNNNNIIIRKMNSEWDDSEMCMEGDGAVDVGAQNRNQAMDFNENNAISDKNNGRVAATSSLLMKRNSRRLAKENIAGSW